MLGVSQSVATAARHAIGTVRDMSYSNDLTDEQWALLKPVFIAPGGLGWSAQMSGVESLVVSRRRRSVGSTSG